jgi:hypothetical protein
LRDPLHAEKYFHRSATEAILLGLVRPSSQERWMQLCEQAAMEQDTERLIDLVEEINRMLDEKEQRLECEQSERGVGI